VNSAAHPECQCLQHFSRAARAVFLPLSCRLPLGRLYCIVFSAFVMTEPDRTSSMINFHQTDDFPLFLPADHQGFSTEFLPRHS
jgi:hypothetical protein